MTTATPCSIATTKPPTRLFALLSLALLACGAPATDNDASAGDASTSDASAGDGSTPDAAPTGASPVGTWSTTSLCVSLDGADPPSAGSTCTTTLELTASAVTVHSVRDVSATAMQSMGCHTVVTFGPTTASLQTMPDGSFTFSSLGDMSSYGFTTTGCADPSLDGMETHSQTIIAGSVVFEGRVSNNTLIASGFGGSETPYSFTRN